MLSAKVLKSNRDLPTGFTEGCVYEVVGKGIGYMLRSPSGRIESFSPREIELCLK
ncbi:hypothetical protein [Vibrio phage vB_VpaP_SJSY21]|nr:hypothetical protein [Vibrio phage vB_VpaP_SJSY21]